MTESSEYAIECEGIQRVYRSRGFFGGIQETVAVDNLNLRIPRGVVFGLLGPNGAGKTTTIRMLATLLLPTKGKAQVFGYDVVRQAKEVRKRIGLVIGGDRGFYGRLTGRENLRYFGALHGLNPSEVDRRANAMLVQFELAEAAGTPVERYSRGMKQKLHIVRGLLTDPDVLFLDEPTIGLDPVAAQQIRKTIPSLAKQGKTILLTTHYMHEADMLCGTVGIIKQGRIIALGSPGEIKQQFSGTYVIEVSALGVNEGIENQLAEIPGVERVEKLVDGLLHKLTIQAKNETDPQAQIKSLIGETNVENIFVRPPSLEEAYLSLLK